MHEDEKLKKIIFGHVLAKNYNIDYKNYVIYKNTCVCKTYLSLWRYSICDDFSNNQSKSPTGRR